MYEGAVPVQARNVGVVVRNVLGFDGCLPLRAHVSRFTKKSLVNVSGRSVKDAVWGLPEVGVQVTHAADENRHLGS